MDTVETLMVEGDGVTLHVRVEGNPNGAPLLLVHGYPDDLHGWDAVVALLQADYRVIRYDVRGAGLSGAPSRVRDYRMEHLSRDLRAVIEATSPGRPVHLVAHDWGSVQAWESVTDPAFASLIASFTSISGPCLDYVGHQSRADLRSGDLERLRAALRQMRASWYVAMFQLPFLPERAWSSERAGGTERALARREGIALDDFRLESRAKDGVNGIQLYRANMGPRLAKPSPRRCAVPVQVVIPRGDLYVGARIARSCEPWVDSLEVEEIDGGHWFFVKDPEALAARITRFVESL